MGEHLEPSGRAVRSASLDSVMRRHGSEEHTEHSVSGTVSLRYRLRFAQTFTKEHLDVTEVS